MPFLSALLTSDASKFVAVMVLGMVFALANIAQAQDDNWCFPGQPWGDGRCENQPTDADNQLMWVNGYWGAQYDAGKITLDELFAINPSLVGYAQRQATAAIAAPTTTTPAIQTALPLPLLNNQRLVINLQYRGCYQGTLASVSYAYLVTGTQYYYYQGAAADAVDCSHVPYASPPEHFVVATTLETAITQCAAISGEDFTSAVFINPDFFFRPTTPPMALNYMCRD